MEHISNEEKAREYLLKEHISPLNNILHQCDLKTEFQYHKDIENAFIKGAEWKDKQHAKEKQQWIDKAMKVICDGCAQKAECEFNNWKTCSTKDELIKAMKGE